MTASRATLSTPSDITVRWGVPVTSCVHEYVVPSVEEDLAPDSVTVVLRITPD